MAKNALSKKTNNALNRNTNEGSWHQVFLGTHRTPRAYRNMTPAQIAADRKRRAKLKMIDMTPAQKSAELARLRAKYGP